MYKELRDLLSDPWLTSLVTWLPLLVMSLMGWIFIEGIATELPIGVVDLDKGRASRALIRHYDVSPSLSVRTDFLDQNEGVAALRAGKIYGLVILPAGLEKETILGRPPQVTAFVNNQFLLIGKIINSALLEAQGRFTAEVEVLENISRSAPVFSMAFSSAIPIGSQMTPLFNIGKNYGQFLLSAIFPALWQIVMVVATVLFLASSHRRYGLSTWLGNRPLSQLFRKLVFFSFIFMAHGAIFLTAIYVWLGWPMHGSWVVLLVAQYLTVWASMAVGCLIYLITRDAARGLSMAAAYTAPALAFMGVTFPVSDMTLPARLWRTLIPISHYIEIQFTQVNYGAPFASAIPQFLALGVFGLVLVLCFILTWKIAAGDKNYVEKPA